MLAHSARGYNNDRLILNFTHINFHEDWNLESCLQNTVNQKNFNDETGGLSVNFNLYHI